MSNNKLNIVFAGTSEFAASILSSLLASPNYNSTFIISAIYTQPDRESGRGRKITPSAVKQIILDYNNAHPSSVINIEQPVDFKNQTDIDKLDSYSPDLMIVVAYGLILPQAVLDIAKYECVNIHASLLPRWRGAAPIQRAIIAGDKKTGIAIQKMERKLDSGPIILSAECGITDTDTTLSLTQKLLDLAKLLVNQLVDNYKTLLNNNYQQQDHSLANYAHKLDKAESPVDWQQSAEIIHRKIRGLNPWPSVTSCGDVDNTVVAFKILNAHVINNNANINPGTVLNSHNKNIIIQTGHNQLEITKLQFSGGNPISAQDALNGKYKALFANQQILK